jgi:hypothetical protein
LTWVACHRASWLPRVPIRMSWVMIYPTPQEAQLPAVQLPQADDADEAVTWFSPPVPVDFETNPQVDISLDRSWLSQPGQAGVSLPRTRASNSFWHTLH